MASTLPLDLDALLEALDAADSAVREVYRKLADDPDLAPEHEGGLRELHATRSELARDAGLAALARWRASRFMVQPTSVTTSAEEQLAQPGLHGVSSEQAVRHEPAPEVSEPVQPTGPIVEPETDALPVPTAPASDAQITQWKKDVGSKGLGASSTHATTAPPAPAQRPWPVHLHEMMCLLGPREADLDDAVALVEELDALDEVATPERQTLWVRFPIEVQKHWLSHLVARTRAMREHPSSRGVIDRIKEIRAVYPEWARAYVPGHINGLQLKHTPTRGTWADDADDHWRALVAVVGHEVPTARKVPPTRKKKERPAVEEEPALVEPGWPLLPVTRGKTALIVGGAPKEPNRDRLETYLRLATLEWPLVDGPRKVEAVAQRIAKGAYDMVIVVQTLIGHPEAERLLDAAKQGRVPWAMVDGYGVSAVRAGLERFVKPPAQAREAGVRP